MASIENLIVGGGIAGLATAWHLARDGAGRCLVLERGRLFGESSGKSAGIFLEVGHDALTLELMRRTGRFLASPPAGFARPLLEPCGVLVGASGARARRLADAAAAHAHAPARELERGRWSALCPYLRPDALERAFWAPTNGRIDVPGLLAGLEAGARGLGVDVRTGVGVAELLLQGERVSGVRLDDGTCLHARHTIMAAGGWAGRLGQTVGSRVALTPTRRHLALALPQALPDTGLPVFWLLADEEFYCKPDPASGALMLCICDEEPVEADEHGALAHMQARILDQAQRYLSVQLPRELTRLWSAMRTFSDDRRFVVGFDPDLESLFWVAGLGGAGMCTGIALGHLAAQQLHGQRPPDPLAQALAPGRLVNTATSVP